MSTGYIYIYNSFSCSHVACLFNFSCLSYCKSATSNEKCHSWENIALENFKMLI